MENFTSWVFFPFIQAQSWPSCTMMRAFLRTTTWLWLSSCCRRTTVTSSSTSQRNNGSHWERWSLTWCWPQTCPNTWASWPTSKPWWRPRRWPALVSCCWTTTLTAYRWAGADFDTVLYECGWMEMNWRLILFHEEHCHWLHHSVISWNLSFLGHD